MCEAPLLGSKAANRAHRFFARDDRRSYLILPKAFVTLSQGVAGHEDRLKLHFEHPMHVLAPASKSRLVYGRAPCRLTPPRSPRAGRMAARRGPPAPSAAATSGPPIRKRRP